MTADRPAILIVDDEPAITRSLARSLRDSFTVFTATSAEQALDIIAREPIAVILTDQRMPDLSGTQLLEQAQSLRPQALGILISGYTDASALVDALNLGNVRGFLPKPWDIQQLRRQLDAAVRSYQVGFLDQDVLHSAADAAGQVRAQVDELRRALDALAAGDTAALMAQWEHIRRDLDEAPGPIAAQSAFFDGPPADAAPISQRQPDLSAELTAVYAEILARAVRQRAHGGDSQLSELLRALSERLGAIWATPRDVVEIHLGGLKRCVADVPITRVVAYTEEARLILPELMGDLVIFYRGWLSTTFGRPRVNSPYGDAAPPTDL